MGEMEEICLLSIGRGMRSELIQIYESNGWMDGWMLCIRLIFFNAFFSILYLLMYDSTC